MKNAFSMDYEKPSYQISYSTEMTRPSVAQVNSSITLLKQPQDKSGVFTKSSENNKNFYHPQQTNTGQKIDSINFVVEEQANYSQKVPLYSTQRPIQEQFPNQQFKRNFPAERNYQAELLNTFQASVKIQQNQLMFLERIDHNTKTQNQLLQQLINQF